MNKTLYQLDSKNKIRSYNISVTNKGSYSTIRILTGLLNGGKTETLTDITEGKNLGKANATTHYEQAVSEAESKVASKIKEGYVDDMANLKSKDVLGSGIGAPMLAQKHHPTGAQSSSKTLAQIGILGKMIMVQPKLDGNRCLIKFDANGKASLYTRSGDLMPVQLPHILASAEVTYNALGLTGEYTLDGELFTKKFSFNKLNGLIKRVTVTAEDIADRREIKYHLYDTMSDLGYEERLLFIQKFDGEAIQSVQTFMIQATDENIKYYLEKFLAEGHEGLMIRQLGMPYEHKRSWQLIKVKVFEDSEFTLVHLEEDVRGGFVGAFVVSDGIHTFNAGASGQSEDERRYMWEHESEFIGKQVTVCYFGRSEYGIPRFPKFKGLR